MTVTDLKRNLNLPFDVAKERVVEALTAEGFGVLTEIDVAATLKKKLDVDVPRYTIMGACNPGMAHKAISTVPDIGVFLPCNVIVYDNGDDTTTVAMVDPNKTIANAGVPELQDVAQQVYTMLGCALKSVSET